MNLGNWDAGADDVDALLRQTAEFQQLRNEGLQLPDGFENEQDAVLAHDLQKLKSKKLPPVAGEIPSNVDGTTLKQSQNAGPKASMAAFDSDDSDDEEAAAAKLLASVVEEVELEGVLEKSGGSTSTQGKTNSDAEPSLDDELERRFLALKHGSKQGPSIESKSKPDEPKKQISKSSDPKKPSAKDSDDESDVSKSVSGSDSDEDSPRPLVPPGKNKGKECCVS